LLEAGENGKDGGSFETYVTRPGGVLAKHRTLLGRITPMSLRVDELAAALIKTLLEGSEARIMENDDLKAAGRKSLASAK
jgi:hypothetical protein